MSFLVALAWSYIFAAMCCHAAYAKQDYDTVLADNSLRTYHWYGIIEITSNSELSHSHRGLIILVILSITAF